MTKALSHAKVTPRRSSDRGHADHGWLNTYHTFSFSDYQNPKFMSFGSVRVLNEDRVAGGAGFPTHPHRNAEIFSYILDGELTHRDSMVAKGREGDAMEKRDDFYRMKRGDVQFTTGGKGIAHSETNESNKDVHFLQIWALPWKQGLTPKYHTRTFGEDLKRKGFVTIISPLAKGIQATEKDEEAAVAAVEGTIPVHADLVFGAGIVPTGATWTWKIGSDQARGKGKVAVQEKSGRKVYLHVPIMGKGGKVKVNGDDEKVLGEGDGCFVEGVRAADGLTIENVGDGEVELVVLDSN
ncbi:hypothetical protein MMC25_002012 [Agyrium rufum]|nr:hypothetical protein [Agyrium rufum]